MSCDRDVPYSLDDTDCSFGTPVFAVFFFLAVIVLGCYTTNWYKCIGLMQRKLLMPLFLYGRIFGAES